MKFGVVGYGVVGRHMATDIERAGHECVVYDPFYFIHSETRELVNECDAAFVCVSTPQGANGAADTRAIDDVFSWLRVPVAIIRSTVPPGTTDNLVTELPYGCEVAFVPEFIGEGVNAPYNAMRQPPFLIVGGGSYHTIEALRHLYNSECEIIHIGALEAEIAKYAENYYLALKVTWANELYDICQSLDADFAQMMAAVTHDYRIGRSHTHVYPDDRGWGGRCLPKDLRALRSVVGVENAPLLDAVIRVNARQRGEDL